MNIIMNILDINMDLDININKINLFKKLIKHTII